MTKPTPDFSYDHKNYVAVVRQLRKLHAFYLSPDHRPAFSVNQIVADLDAHLISLWRAGRHHLDLEYDLIQTATSDLLGCVYAIDTTITPDIAEREAYRNALARLRELHAASFKDRPTASLDPTDLIRDLSKHLHMTYGKTQPAAEIQLCDDVEEAFIRYDEACF